MKAVVDTAETPAETKKLPRRLCSEIQLFDLCELERCRYRDDRFCTDPDMLARFEAVAEPEDRPAHRYAGDDDDDELEERYPEEAEEDDDDYSVFDEEDGQERLSDDEW